MLEDGRTFAAESYGAVGTTVGEAVFATGMTGYQETLTDPSYHRQVVVDDRAAHRQHRRQRRGRRSRGRIWVAGYVVRDPARRAVELARRAASSPTSSRAQGVVGISGVDTRALTRHLRERGAMRVGHLRPAERRPAEELLDVVRAARPMAGADLAGEVTTRRAVRRAARSGSAGSRVAAVDLGIKAMTPRRMAERGIEVHVLPATATLDDVLATGPTASSSPTAPATRRPSTGR